MGNSDKLLTRILSGTADNNIAFDDLRLILLQLGSTEHVAVITSFGGRAFLSWSTSNVKKMAKPYQVRQVRATILRHKLGDEL